MSIAARTNSIFLHPGDYCFARSDTAIRSTLGSCIAICLWHPALQFGIMCHFVLPSRGRLDLAANELDGRYGEEAIILMEGLAVEHGTTLSEYHAKIFGGADVLGNEQKNHDFTIGQRNAEFAMTQLLARSVNVLVANVGESGYRQVIFDTTTGDVWVRHESACGTLQKTTSGAN